MRLDQARGKGHLAPAAKARRTVTFRPVRPRRSGPVGATRALRDARPEEVRSKQRVGRIALVALFVLPLLVVLGPTVMSYWQQQDQVRQLRAQVAEQRQRVAELERQRAAWDNPAFVEREARSRLKFVRPGEVSYIVIDDSGRTWAPDAPPPPSADTLRSDPWYSQLGDSIAVVAKGTP